MNTLLINTLYFPYKVGGAEVSVRLLAEGLVKSGHIVTVLSIHEGKDLKIDMINGVTVYYIPFANFYWQFSNSNHNAVKRLCWHLVDNYNLFLKKTIKKIIKEINPDIVHTNNLSGISVAVWDIAEKNGCKIVHTSRDYYLLHPNCKMYKNNCNMTGHESSVKLWSFFKKIKSKKVDFYVGISDYIRNKHIDAGFFDKDKAITIYNAVDNKDMSYNSTTSEGARNVGFIGRLTKEKGFDIFCRMAEKYNNQNFIAAGEFEYNKDAEELKELASKNNIKLLGHCPVTEFMKMVDLIVLPIKWQEPFGRVVLESVFSGKIILTNKVGGITELASMLPNIYFLEDIQDLNDVPQYKQIPNQAIDKFNSGSITREYEKIFEGLLNG